MALLAGLLASGSGALGPRTVLAQSDNRAVPPWPPVWRAPQLQDHPLAGRIWSPAKGDFLTAQDYGTALAKTRFVLLGEVHDNPDHHRLQAWAIRAIAKLRGARLVEGAPQMDIVAMEMLTTDEQAALDSFYGRNARVPRPRTAADFGRLLKWDKLGWPAYEIYQPIVEEAINANLVIAPASPARSENRAVSKQGLAVLAVKEKERLALDRPLASDMAEALSEEIRESHCGMLPETALPGMSLVQRLRDARMADALLKSDWKGAALIAGNGHVRRDRGVPWYLSARGIARAEVAIVRHIEVEEGKFALDDYQVGKAGQAADLADFVVFTPRQPRPDGCEEMRRQMEAIKAQRRAREPAGQKPPDAGTDPQPR